VSARVRTVPGEPLLVVDGRPQYLAGANYAWHRYGEFGESLWGGVNRVVLHAPAIDADLAAMRGHGARAVRWFLFTDGRSGIRFSADSGLPTGLADGTIEDIAAAGSGDVDLFGIPASGLDADRPILIGEVPGRNDPHPLHPALEDWLSFGLTGGYAGVWPWAFTAGPGDRCAPYDGARMKAFYERDPGG
jgi:hypothetical protein